ncbi:hypothetical protein BBJ28_00026751, partial [Nothophytophthora sp. Chile5]
MNEATQATTTTITTTTAAGQQLETVVTTTTTSSEDTTTETTEATEPTTTEKASVLATAMDAGKFTVIPEFGGQGISYWTELQRLYAASETSKTRAFLDSAAQALLEETSSDEAKASVAFEAVIDVNQWLQSLEIGDAPAGLKLDRVFFSAPMLMLTQCANYLDFLETTGVSHESMVKNASTAVGHSQGIASAVVFSAAKTADEFHELAVSLLRYMFWQGLRTQETY